VYETREQHAGYVEDDQKQHHIGKQFVDFFPELIAIVAVTPAIIKIGDEEAGENEPVKRPYEEIPNANPPQLYIRLFSRAHGFQFVSYPGFFPAAGWSTENPSGNELRRLSKVKRKPDNICLQ